MERLNKSDYRFLAICGVLLAATVWFSANFFYRAFPEASIDFQVTREGSLRPAETFLRERGFSTDGYRHASRFGFDNNSKTFLERELGLEKANRLLGTRVRLWRWSHRWFRPQQKEEFRVEITPRGETVGFEHQLEEQAALPSLEVDAARSQAETYLTDVMKRPADTLEFLTISSIQRPRRTDHTFTWRERDFRVKEAEYRFEVTVLGNQIGGYREYLKIPEAWLRDYERLRSANNTTQIVATAFMLLLILGLLVVIVQRVRRHDVRWRVALLYGVVAAVLMLLVGLNSLPLSEFNYPTTDAYASFLVRSLLQMVLGALASGVFVMLLVAAAEPLYREKYRNHISIGNLFSARGLRTRRFLKGAVLGVTLTGCFVAYQIAFYMLAYRFGAWSPADVPYSELLSTYLPWVFVLIGGFMPAVTEEFLFRVFAIPHLEKLFRLRWIALVLAGFIWGFGHSSYPQQPFFIRGIEVGIGGVVLGVIMLRWGILPALVWHYSVDALYTALLMLRSSNPYFILSGAVSAGVVALPILVALVLYLRRGGFEPETGLTNAQEQPPPAEAAPELDQPAAPAVEPGYEPWPRRRRLVVIAAAAVSFAAFLLFPSGPFGDLATFSIGKGEARTQADEFARERGVDPGGWRTVVYPRSEMDPLVTKYLLERRSMSQTAQLWRDHANVTTWTVRYFRPVQKEEVRAHVDARSRGLAGFEHSLDEDAPGADVPSEQARAIAEQWIQGRGLTTASLELKESNSEKRKARRDHRLVWEARDGDARNVEDARYRVEVRIAGDRVIGHRVFWKLPEAYTRARNERNALAIATFVGKILFGLFVAGFAMWILLQATRSGKIRWRTAVIFAVPLTVIGIAGSLMELPMAFRTYDTTMPAELYRITLAVGLMMGGVGIFIFIALQAALLLALVPDAQSMLRSRTRAAMGADALAATALAVAVSVAYTGFQHALAERFHDKVIVSLPSFLWFGSLSPSVSAITQALTGVLASVSLIALAVYTVKRLLRGRWWAIAAAASMLAAALTSNSVRTPGEFFLEWTVSVVGMALVAGFVLLVKRNLLAYALAALILPLAESARRLLAQQHSGLQLQGWIVAGVALAILIWAVLPAWTGHKQSEPRADAAAG